MGPSQYDVHLVVLHALGPLKFTQPREGLDFLPRTANPFYRCERARRIPPLAALKTI